MTSLPCWITSPLILIQEEFLATSQGWEDRVSVKFQEHISKDRDQIPWLSSDSPSGSLVRYWMMVQDTLDQEFYTKQYLARDNNKNEHLGTGKYSDVLNLPEGYEVDWEDNTHLHRDSRLVYYGVPVPGRNTWTRDVTRPEGGDVTRPEGGDVTRPNTIEIEKKGKKRAPEKVEEMDTRADDNKKIKNVEGNGKGEEEKEEETSKFLGLNMVLPTDTGPCCIALVYTPVGSQDTSPIKINDVLEVVGILERLELPAECELEEEEAARFPPSSIVPRLHCLDVQRRTHLNSRLPHPLDMGHQGVEAILAEAEIIRSELICLLKECLLGDPLAAEYLLLHLLSHVYGRQDDVMALGKFAMNLTGCPAKEGMFVRCLSTLIGNISEKSCLFPMTITNFNNSCMIPRKDYTANRLKSGLLQLPLGSQIILDETVLEPGQLETNGVENLKSLGNLISWQKLTYDFGFSYNIEFECDTRVLVLGEGKSLLPSDVLVPLKVMTESPNYEGILAAVSSTPLLGKFRRYLTIVRHIEYKQVSDAIQDRIEKDFVEERKKDPKSVTGETLHRLLVIARLYGLSRGHLTLQEGDWLAAKSLERDRLSRIGGN